jgi:hypothetical protein
VLLLRNFLLLLGCGDLLKLGSDTLKGCFEAWFSVLSAPERFTGSLDLTSNETLTRASVFAVFISLVNLLIQGPVLRSLGVQLETPTYLLVDTVLTYAGFFLAGVLYHLAAKIVRGRGALLGSLVAFLYLTAWKPIGELITTPLVIEAMPLWVKHSGTREFMSEFSKALADQPELLLSFALLGSRAGAVSRVPPFSARVSFRAGGACALGPDAKNGAGCLHKVNWKDDRASGQPPRRLPDERRRRTDRSGAELAADPKEGQGRGQLFAFAHHLQAAMHAVVVVIPGKRLGDFAGIDWPPLTLAFEAHLEADADRPAHKRLHLG